MVTEPVITGDRARHHWWESQSSWVREPVITGERASHHWWQSQSLLGREPVITERASHHWWESQSSLVTASHHWWQSQSSQKRLASSTWTVCIFLFTEEFWNTQLCRKHFLQVWLLLYSSSPPPPPPPTSPRPSPPPQSTYPFRAIRFLNCLKQMTAKQKLSLSLKQCLILYASKCIMDWTWTQ